MIPDFAMKILGVVILLAALVTGYFTWESHIDKGGYDRAIAERKASDERQEKVDQAAALVKERQAQIDSNKANKLRQQKDADYEKTIEGLRADARRGNSGLRCPAVRLQTNTTSETASVSPGPGQAIGQQLVPEAADDLLSVAGDISKGMSRYNGLLEAYHRLHDFCKSD